MNKKRAVKIIALSSQIEDMKLQLEAIRDEEREQFDNMSERAQEGEKGQQVEQSASHLEDACDNLDSVISALSEATC